MENKEINKNKAIEYYRFYFISMLSEKLHINCHPLYRPWTVNMRLLVDDIINYLSSEDVLIRDHQVKVLLNEFFYLSKKDAVFISQFERNSIFLIKEIQNISNKKNTIDDKDKLKHLFLILQPQLKKKYISTLQGLLNSFFSNDKFYPPNIDVNKKISKLKTLTNILLAELLYDKYSRKYLNFIIKKDYYNNDRNFDNFFDNFYGLLLHDPTEYKILLQLHVSDKFNKNKNIHKDVFIEYLRELNINIIDANQYEEIYNKLDGEFKQDIILHNDNNITHTVFVKVIFQGWDIFKIAYAIRNDIIAQCDLFLYEKNSCDILVDKIVLLQRNNISQDVFSVNTEEEECFNIKYGSIRLLKKNVKLFYTNSMPGVNDSTLVKLKNSIRYYRRFLNESSKELKLLNLWIAFESIFASEKSTNSFNDIKNILPKIVNIYFLREIFDETLSYIIKKTEKEKELIEARKLQPQYSKYNNLMEYIKQTNTYTKKGFINDETTNKFNNIGIFRILCCEQKNKQFFEAIKDNPYFFNKYKEIANIVNINQKNRANNILPFLKNRHGQTQRNIARIYRIRNFIVHCGNETKMIDAATSSLESFYFLLLDDILDKLTSEKYGANSIQEYFDRLKRSHSYYEQLLTKNLTEDEYKFLVLPYFIF